MCASAKILNKRFPLYATSIQGIASLLSRNSTGPGSPRGNFRGQDPSSGQIISTGPKAIKQCGLTTDSGTSNSSPGYKGLFSHGSSRGRERALSSKRSFFFSSSRLPAFSQEGRRSPRAHLEARGSRCRGFSCNIRCVRQP